MKNFEDIKAQWENQGDIKPPVNGIETIINKTNALKNGQRITNSVLGVTAGLLVVFFFYVKAYLEVKATIALSLMILVIFIRIALEIISLNTLKHINFAEDNQRFKNRLLRYYKKRLRTHYIFTPIILLFYIVGFVMLMPYFKMSLSKGFYTYIQISGCVIISVGLFLLFKVIKKELLSIKQLMN